MIKALRSRLTAVVADGLNAANHQARFSSVRASIIEARQQRVGRHLRETCTDANSSNPTKNVGTACTAATAGSDTSALTGTDSTPGGTLAGASVVTTNNGFGALTNGTNNYYLDVQELELGTNFLGGGYLDSITIQSNSPSGSNSKILLSGLSADVVASAPEPGTVAMLSIGSQGLGGFLEARSLRAQTACRHVD